VTLNCLALNPLNGLAPRCIEVVDGSNVKAEVASKAMGESQTTSKTATRRHNQAIRLQNQANQFEVSLEVERREKALPVFFSAMPDASCRGGIVLVNTSKFEDSQIIRSMPQRGGQLRTSSQQESMLETACYLQRVKVAVHSWLGMLLIA
jgi:hypothetical protein